jgi:CRISPR-associated protein Csx14
MTTPVPDITLDVDLRNPGQFFACCGVLELASRLWPGSEGWFGKEGSGASFHIATYSGNNDPLGEIVRQLCEPDDLVALADDHEAQAQADRKPVMIVPFALRLDWWLDSYRGGDKSELKVWAGQQTPERNINSMRNAWREILAQAPHESTSQVLFRQRRPMTGRFGFDPAASWEALDVGFSPDEQGVPVQTSPATEILAAIGLQRCRPAAVENRRRWFVYRAWQDPVEIAVAAAAVLGAGRTIAAYEFPVVMRNAQYGSFAWAKPLEGE